MWIDGILLVLVLASVLLYWSMMRPAAAIGPPGGAAALPPAPYAQGGGSYDTLIRQAGFLPTRFRLLLWPVKLGFAVLLPLVYVELMDGRAIAGWALLLAALLGLFLPDIYLLLRRRGRRLQITRSLSYFLDMIVAFLLAGIGVEEAFRRAGAEGLPPKHPLREEVDIVAREIDSGRDRAEAFQALADRTGVADLQNVAGAMRMGLRIGAPIRQTLEAQADILRIKRREDGVRRINRAVISAVVPVALCGFPILFVLIFFPTVIELLHTTAWLKSALIGR